MSHRSGAGANRQDTILVVAPADLARLIVLVVRHLGLRAATAGTASAARALLRRRPILVIAATSVAGVAPILLAAAGQGAATLAVVDLERGGSSLRAFAAGADQVIRVPFTPDELAVRAGALMRRLGHEIPLVRDTALAGLSLNLDEFVAIGPAEARLTPSQNSLLYLLASNPARTVSRDQMRRLVWGLDRSFADGAVDGVVSELARTIGDHPGKHYTVQASARGASLGPPS